MTDSKAGQVLFQLTDQLRGPLRPEDAQLLAFQLLVWAHLGEEHQIHPADMAETALHGGSREIVEALNRLSMSDGLLGHAFSGAASHARAAGTDIESALSAAKRLADGGIFERFSPADIAAELATPRDASLGLPKELVAMVAELAVGFGARSVYCPWEMEGQLISATLCEAIEVFVETPYLSPLVALFALFHKGEILCEVADPLATPTAIKSGRLKKFDSAMSFPPFGMLPKSEVANQDIYGRFPIKQATVTGLMIQHILAQTDGRAVIVVPNSFLFGPGRDRDLRQYLLENGWVTAVVGLPGGIYKNTGIGSGLLLLDTRRSHDRVGFIDAGQPYFCQSINRTRKALINTGDIVAYCNALSEGDTERASALLGQDLAVTASFEELQSNDFSFAVERYVVSESQRRLQGHMQRLETAELGEVAELLNPVPNKDRNQEGPEAIEVLEVGAQDLPANGYIKTPEKKVNIVLPVRRSGSGNDVFLRPGDVVLITKGSTGKVGIVPEDVPPAGKGGWIAGQSAIVLRSSDGKADLRWLGLWLRSKMGQGVLSGITSGSTIPMISIQTLRKLEVPVVALADQSRAGEVLQHEMQLQARIDELREEQSGLAENLWAELLG
ncbi:N-6 DNA methylase [Stenotrophomonas koreensis]|nr:N-6 DNA methylase [Stenotrophomonas koreensis]